MTISLQEVLNNVKAFGEAAITLAFGDSATEGSSAKAARADHGHGMPESPAASALASDSLFLSSGSLSTTSTSLVDLTGVTLTITTGANRVQVGLVTSTGQTVQFGLVTLNVDIDGSPQLGAAGVQTMLPTATQRHINHSFTMLSDALTAASHTIKIRWVVSTGTGTLRAEATNTLNFWVKETE